MSDQQIDPAAKKVAQVVRRYMARGGPYPSLLALTQTITVENQQVYGPVLKALQSFVSHTLIQGQEWPCSYCGRYENEPLQKLKIQREDDSFSYEGCWYCNMRPVLKQACIALTSFRQRKQEKGQE